MNSIHPFEKTLSVIMADIELELRGHPELAWADFLLNPHAGFEAVTF